MVRPMSEQLKGQAQQKAGFEYKKSLCELYLELVKGFALVIEGLLRVLPSVLSIGTLPLLQAGHNTAV